MIGCEVGYDVNTCKHKENSGSFSCFIFTIFIMMIVAPSIIFTNDIVQDFGKYQHKIDAIIVGNYSKLAYSCQISCPSYSFTKSDACGIMASQGQAGSCVGGTRCTSYQNAGRDALALDNVSDRAYHRGSSSSKKKKCVAYENVPCNVFCSYSYNLFLKLDYVVNNKTYEGEIVGSNCQNSLENCISYWKTQTELDSGNTISGYINSATNGDFTTTKKKYNLAPIIVICVFEFILFVLFLVFLVYTRSVCTTTRVSPF